ncbi:MAG: hypothetical protein DSM106950_16630 [Stigonema ocellatum SAG 48.90 = DSM 106950]|nr:hypothetical protein [Stigonema ocellatum SAG 48.90 = DSM 106950]
MPTLHVFQKSNMIPIVVLWKVSKGDPEKYAFRRVLVGYDYDEGFEFDGWKFISWKCLRE